MQQNLYECMYSIVFSYFLPNVVFGNCQATPIVSCLSDVKEASKRGNVDDDDDDFIKHFETWPHATVTASVRELLHP